MTLSASEQQSADLDAVNADLQRIAQHQTAGRLAEAGAMLDNLLIRYPGHPRLLHLKGLNLAQTGKVADGLALLDAVIADSPDPVVLVDAGTLRAQSGDLPRALDSFQQAVEIAPNYALAHANLGAAQLLNQQFRAAIPHLQKALELDNRVLDVHLNLAQALIRVGNFDPAIDTLYKALAIDPKSAAAHSHLAAALFRRERHDSAEHHARRAIELAPDAAEPKLHLGNVLAAAGRMDEAVQLLLEIAGKPPTGATALSRLVHLRKTTEDSPELAILRQYQARLADLVPEYRSTLQFALGKAEDDLGNHAAAMEHYHKANAESRALHPYDIDAFRTRATRLEQLVTPDLITRCGGAGISDIAPIFIVGMPRSGTTLMDQMFSRHPDVQAGGELAASPRALRRNARIRAALEQEISPDDLTADDFARLGEDYIAGLHAEGLRAGYVSDKMPANYLYVGLLAMALPRARFLIMRRHPLDCLLSNYMQNFGQNQPFSTRFSDLAQVYRSFDRLARHWSALLPDRVREVPYEAVVAEPEARMREIIAFAGLDWSDAVLDHTRSSHQVNTASMAQVRQPIYGSAVARWRRYGPLLHDLAAELRDVLSDDELAACGVAPAA
ncbi:tetratricopeptide repeat-containing sulfotransferase family protein [Tropicibacter oceani]|uniref:Sulfotransferase n=1 Tax=Tropicibacter oceani TaxID=3058420 RepID=A0ABY8QEP3_9RHOB|nr:tetratricopeptide repeat-containing sulfotransferase family protein [Tropicibacter oceani]WGW02979.1 sulfotransferase [Tropicibacter oceani]